jgi:hypothetical protein
MQQKNPIERMPSRPLTNLPKDVFFESRIFNPSKIKSSHNSNHLLDLIHRDLSDKVAIPFLNKSHYYLLFLKHKYKFINK